MDEYKRFCEYQGSIQADKTLEPGQRLFAFWRYDTLPYFLGGEVEEILESGKVRLKSVYKSLEVTPVKILPYEIGIKAKARLEELGRETREK